MWFLVFLVCFLSIASANHESAYLKNLEVKDVDFENTKITKTCLKAQLNASLVIYHKETSYWKVYKEIIVPQHVSTAGSFCNVKYESDLRLTFHGNNFNMMFKRDEAPISKPKKYSYCDHCDYGTWVVSNITTKLHTGQYQFEAAKSDLPHNAQELFSGIEITRSFKCDEKDRLIKIPLDMKSVMNLTSHHRIGPEDWKAEVVFYSIQVQPFLVFSDHFTDPYLCRDITTSHILVIFLPLVYFVFFIAYYQIKEGQGCPPWRSRSPKAEKLEVEADESTNMMSEDFSTMQTMQMGLTSAHSNF